jgi:hypothetical protein
VADDDGRFVDMPRRLTCESKSKKRRFCGASISVGAVVSEQLSSTPRGRQHLGLEPQRIWVTAAAAPNSR